MGLQIRLWCARKLLQNDLLVQLQKERLASIVGDLWDLLAYDNLSRQGVGAIGITIARAECVLLAVELKNNGHYCHEWLENGLQDPLPEVRFAALNEQFRKSLKI